MSVITIVLLERGDFRGQVRPTQTPTPQVSPNPNSIVT